MTDYLRRLVSGSKARFKDRDLKLELDLVYVTDQIIIMGYPASGFEGLYRNRREDAIRFLESRHGKNYWVFNFCPLKENSYDADVFGGRVSRYPFPDHHAPPLAIMPLFVREMNAWLKGSPDRVAVLHCKAGKGRSGTMACSYLLSLEEDARPPVLQRSYSAKQWAARRMKDAVDVLPPDEENQPPNNTPPSTSTSVPRPFEKSPPPQSDTEGLLDIDTGSPPLATSTSPPNMERSFTDTLKGVLDLHTARRMKPPSEKEGKAKQGVSIPSQRRFLYYWALLLAHEAPLHMWAVRPNTGSLPRGPILKSDEPRPKVLLTQVRLRLRETSGIKLNIIKAASLLLEKTNKSKTSINSFSSESESKSNGNEKDQDKDKKEKLNASYPSSPPVWASLARYDDGLIDLLEDWEVYTRDTDGHLARRRPGSDHLPRGESTEEEVLNQVFETGKWDKEKMVRSFARLGGINKNDVEKLVDEEEGKIYRYTFRPLSDDRWKGLRHDLHEAEGHGHENHHTNAFSAIDDNAAAIGVSRSEVNSINEESPLEPRGDGKQDLKSRGSDDDDAVVHNQNLERGILLDAGREVRMKLYMGQVFMGWIWFIPTFHMSQPPPTRRPADPTSTSNSLKSTLHLTRKEIDFPIGIGSAIMDVQVDMEWDVSVTASASCSHSDSPITQADAEA